MSNRQSDRSGPCRNFRLSQLQTRRQVLHAGALSALGLGLSDFGSLLSSAGAAGLNSTSSGQLRSRPAKACIFLFMWGGPSQLETFDLKPDAPDEVRGDFKPTQTKVPGLHIAEHFQKLSKLMDKVSIVRSLSHSDPAHLSSGHATLTGNLAPVVKSDADPPSPKDSPHLGSLISKLKPADGGLPSFVHMPWKALHPAAPGGVAPGQHGGWLGASYDGMLLSGDPNHPDWKPQGLTLPANISLERLQSRVELMRRLGVQRRAFENAAQTAAFNDQQQQAFNMLSSNAVQSAFDITQEDDATRDRYGRNIHGQCVLMARRLVEHGVPLVSVNWHNDGRNFWDTHGDNFNRLKNDLIPPADAALSALLEDLDQRGMLEETIVVWVGEFGRKPQITANNAGREHWPFCYSGLIAGGGFKGGHVYGKSDRHAAYPAENPVSPQDFATTILHAMGIPTDLTLLDRENRPHHICTGKIIDDLLT